MFQYAYGAIDMHILTLIKSTTSPCALNYLIPTMSFSTATAQGKLWSIQLAATTGIITTATAAVASSTGTSTVEMTTIAWPTLVLMSGPVNPTCPSLWVLKFRWTHEWKLLLGQMRLMLHLAIAYDMSRRKSTDEMELAQVIHIMGGA